jgi:hypothetical protein
MNDIRRHPRSTPRNPQDPQKKRASRWGGSKKDPEMWLQNVHPLSNTQRQAAMAHHHGAGHQHRVGEKDQMTHFNLNKQLNVSIISWFLRGVKTQ